MSMHEGKTCHYSGESVGPVTGLHESSIVGGGAIAILIGLIVFFGQNKKRRGFSDRRYDLLKNSFVNRMVRSRYFSFSLRLIPAALFVLVIAAGLFGVKHNNIAAPFTWLFWWTALIFFVAFAGKIFCAACPWDFFANLFQFGWLFPSRKAKKQTLGRKWPKALANIYPATVFFVLITWLELGFDVTQNSFTTAVMGLVVVGTAILTALVFEKRGFCRYACPIGRISGLYAQISPIELRRKSESVCKGCKTKDCVKGGEYSTPCPTGETPFKLDQNTYCTLCTECVRSCDKNNLTLKLRPPGTDLQNPRVTRPDEIILAIVLLILTYFHGLTMTGTWFEWTGAISKRFELTYFYSFSILMALILIISGLFLWFFAYRMFGRRTAGLIMSLVPLTLGYHLGHNSMHLFGEVTYLVPLIADPFGWGWNLFGLGDFKPFPLLGAVSLRWLQIACVVVGGFYSIRILRLRVQNISQSSNQAVLYLGNATLLVAIMALSLWLIYQPMVMRSGM